MSKLTTQVERLISDVSALDIKVDEVRHNVSFVRGALWVMGGVIAILTLLATWYVAGKFSISLKPS